MKNLRSSLCLGAVVLATATPLLSLPANAGALDRIKNSISNIWGQSSSEREEARKARARATQLNNQASAVHERLEKTQQQLVQANAVFQSYSRQAKQTEARIVKTRHRVQIVTTRYERHKELFGARLASVQRNGQLSYLNMVLGSRTLSDLSRRVYLYQSIASRDSDLQKAIKEDKVELERAQNQLMAEWQERNRLQQAAVKERARIVRAEQEQQKYLKEIKSSVYAQLAYAEAKEQTASGLQNEIRQLESQRAQIIAVYEAKRARERAARNVPRYRRQRVAREVTRTKYVRSAGGELKPVEVKEIVYQDVMVPDTSGSELGESFETDHDGHGWSTPARGRLSSRYGMRHHPILNRRKLHTGDDIAAPHGSPIKAAKSGRVLYSGWKRGYGNTVIIDHGGGVTTLYGHASKLGVQAGQPVKSGEYIGNVGSTGYSTGPHLHFEVRKNGRPVNPRPYLRKSR